MVFYLMAEEGWSPLARRYRARAAFLGPWRPCPTGTMALVSVDDPAFQRRKLRLVGGTLRIGTSPDALHLSMALLARSRCSAGSSRTCGSPGRR